MEQGQISAEEFAALIEAAQRIQREQPRATRFYWADQAVRLVLGDRLGIADKIIPPRSMPLYYGMVSRVEAALWQKSPPPTAGASRSDAGGLVPKAQADLDGQKERVTEGVSK